MFKEPGAFSRCDALLAKILYFSFMYIVNSHFSKFFLLSFRHYLEYNDGKKDGGIFIRTEQEMLNLIIDTAKKDERIRAVIMNGSRANPNAPKDRFRDFDIVYIVTDVDSFTADHSWIDIFGKRIMLQMPEAMRDPVGDGRFIYLMLFEDGNRIDLQLIPIEKHKSMLDRDSESILLLDKDGIIPTLPPASDSDYLIKPPTALEYDSCCNDFWWCTQNVAKGLWRDELPYAMFMLYSPVKDNLHDMIEWYIGVKNGFNVCAGKMGKYFKRFLDKGHYGMYLKIYSDSDAEHIWEALFAACELFRDLAKCVAAQFNFTYPESDDKKMTEYLKRVMKLPKNGER